MQEGETLRTIADRYGVTVDDLLAANDLEDGEIAVGDTLVIPEPQPGAAAAPTVQSPFEIGETVEVSGMLHATIYEGEDSRRVQAALVVDGQPRYPLIGPLDVLEDVAQLDGLHVRMHGRAISGGEERSPGRYVIAVEDFEKIQPEEQVEGFLGHIEEETLEGETVAIFIDHEAEQRYVVASSLAFEGPGPSVGPYPSTTADQHFVVGVVEPGRSFAGMPVLRIHRMRKDSQTGAATSADEIPLEVPRVVDESHTFRGPFAELEGALLVDRVELSYYYDPQPGYVVRSEDSPPPTPEPPEETVVQPVWVFHGRNADGSVRFTAYVQAAKEELVRDE